MSIKNKTGHEKGVCHNVLRAEILAYFTSNRTTNILRLLPYLLLLILCTSCQKYALDNLPAERLHFGNSGGFTGETREYILLLNNGKILFNNQVTNELEKIGKMPKDELIALKAELATIDFDQAANKPGNMNTLLAYHKDGLRKELQWTGPKSAPSNAAGHCFSVLMARVRALRGAE